MSQPQVATRLDPKPRDFPKPPAHCVVGDSKLSLLSGVSFVSTFLEEKMFGTAGRELPVLEPQEALLCAV